jgi:hypothetical protein
MSQQIRITENIKCNQYSVFISNVETKEFSIELLFIWRVIKLPWKNTITSIICGVAEGMDGRIR